MVGLRLEIGGTMHLEKYDPSEWNNKHLHWILNQFYKSADFAHPLIYIAILWG